MAAIIWASRRGLGGKGGHPTANLTVPPAHFLAPTRTSKKVVPLSHVIGVK